MKGLWCPVCKGRLTKNPQCPSAPSCPIAPKFLLPPAPCSPSSQPHSWSTWALLNPFLNPQSLSLPLLISHIFQILSMFPGPTLGRSFLGVWSLLGYNHSDKYRFARSHQFVTSWLMELLIAEDKLWVRALIIQHQFRGTIHDRSEPPLEGGNLEIIPFQPAERDWIISLIAHIPHRKYWAEKVISIPVNRVQSYQ